MLVAEQAAVHVSCRDGYVVADAVVRAADVSSILVETSQGLELLFTDAIVSIVRRNAAARERLRVR
jgi:hypothetical protein